VTVALASRRPGAARAVSIGVLGVASVLGLAQTFDLGFPHVPGPATPLAGGALGAAAALAASRLRAPPLPAGARALAVLASLAAAAGVLALGADGFVERHVRAGGPGTDLVRWFTTQPEFEGRGRPIDFDLVVVSGMLAGDRVQHTLKLLPDYDCTRIRRTAREGWVVSKIDPFRGVERCLGRLRPLHAGFGSDVYAIR
jgi:hypothetical protein